MPVMVQIRNMPDGVHRRLMARAAASGLSLSDYLLQMARREAEQPSLDELWERIRSRTPAKGPIDGAELVRLGRDGR